MIINPSGGVPFQNPGSGTPGGQMPMGMHPQMGMAPPQMGQLQMGMAQPQAPILNPTSGAGSFRPNGLNMFGQTQQQVSRPQFVPGALGTHAGGPLPQNGSSQQQNLMRQYATAQQLRGSRL